MRNKKGQFYFISALVIILIIISFVVLNNSSSKSKDTELKDLEKELNLEIEKLFEWTAQNSLNNEFTEQRFSEFSTDYLVKIGKNKNVVFIFGDKRERIIFKGYRMLGSEEISAESGGIVIDKLGEGVFEEIIEEPGNEVTLTSGGNVYAFDLREGKNFYYYITKEYKGEKQIIVG